MRYLLKLVVLSSMFFGYGALACSFGGSDLFQPTLERWEQHPGLAQKGEQGDYWEQVPAPVVKITSITRGTTAPGSSCSDAGTLSLEISLPEESTYSIKGYQG